MDSQQKLVGSMTKENVSCSIVKLTTKLNHAAKGCRNIKPFVMAKQKTYIVTAFRYGKRENHSYISGVFTKKAQAIKDAEEETTYRGGKYSCQVEEMILNEAGREKHLKPIYLAKGHLCDSDSI